MMLQPTSTFIHTVTAVTEVTTMLSAGLLLCMCLTVQASDLDIYSLHVTSDITYRYASTRVVSRMANRGANATEARFLIQLPNSAFISNFSMEIDGKVYPASVKEKEQAKRIYERAKKRGKSAGHVSQKSRDARIFKIAVNVAGNSKVTFNLTYQELLRRKLGVYEHVIYINPGQPIRDMSINVNINELKTITFLKVPSLQPLKDDLQNSVIGSADNALAQIRRPTETSAQIVYQPSMEEQSAGGVSGKFIVQYDVQRTMDGGEIYAVDGYFVHYFSPPIAEGAIPNKDIVFVLDRSGSMGGVKIRQLKEAMAAILNQLKYGDNFNIITFSHGTTYMVPNNLIKFDAASLERAKLFMARVDASGGTNINDAVLRGLAILQKRRASGRNGDRPSLLVFLTDGQPTSGETNTGKIVQNIVSANSAGVAVYSLGFGNDVDFDFLKKISLRNNGFARKIYQAADASLQLKNFYQEVGTPLLSRVDIKYLGDTVAKESVTKADYNLLFKGSEIVVAGRMAEDHSNVISQVRAVSGEGPMELNATAVTSPPPGSLRGVTERLWAYLTIQQLLDAMVEETDQAKKDRLKARALQLSLKYNFVTPLTSMVVVKPEDQKDEAPEPKTTPLPLPTTAPGGTNTGKGSSVTRRRWRGSSGVDNDPHFMLTLGKEEVPVCFDVMGNPGDVFRLIYDRGLTVNGYIIPGKTQIMPDGKRHPKTYFGKIAVITKKATLLILPQRLKIKGCDLRWERSGSCVVGDLEVKVVKNTIVTVRHGGVTLTVLRHPLSKTLIFGVYLSQDSVLSDQAQGVIGRLYALDVQAFADIQTAPQKSQSTLLLHDRVSDRTEEILVTAGKRRNMLLKKVMLCWFVHNNGGALIGDYRHYLVSRLTESGPGSSSAVLFGG